MTDARLLGFHLENDTVRANQSKNRETKKQLSDPAYWYGASN